MERANLAGEDCGMSGIGEGWRVRRGEGSRRQEMTIQQDSGAERPGRQRDKFRREEIRGRESGRCELLKSRMLDEIRAGGIDSG